MEPRPPLRRPFRPPLPPTAVRSQTIPGMDKFLQTACPRAQTSSTLPRSPQLPPLQPVFNGEIYNCIELREELIAQGESFSTDGDTEVLLTLWRRMGPDCLAKLRGMFAFALLDQQGGLWLVRDPFGIKPLYWTRKDDGIYFASEIRGLHVAGILPRRLRESAVIRTASIGINKLGDDDTLFEAVHELPPGF